MGGGKHYPATDAWPQTVEEYKRTQALEAAIADIESDGDCLLVVYDFVKKQKVCSRYI